MLNNMIVNGRLVWTRRPNVGPVPLAECVIGPRFQPDPETFARLMEQMTGGEGVGA